MKQTQTKPVPKPARAKKGVLRHAIMTDVTGTTKLTDILWGFNFQNEGESVTLHIIAKQFESAFVKAGAKTTRQDFLKYAGSLPDAQAEEAVERLTALYKAQDELRLLEASLKEGAKALAVRRRDREGHDVERFTVKADITSK